MRIKIKDLEPKAYALMSRFEEYLEKSDIPKTHRELIKIRASQLNNCAYCLDTHIKDAIEAGESERRIHLLSVWNNVPSFFTEEEKIILKMTEEITLIKSGLSDETYNIAMSLFPENHVAQIIMAIIVINSWNRIGVSTHMEDSLDA